MACLHIDKDTPHCKFPQVLTFPLFRWDSWLPLFSLMNGVLSTMNSQLPYAWVRFKVNQLLFGPKKYHLSSCNHLAIGCSFLKADVIIEFLHQIVESDLCVWYPPIISPIQLPFGICSTADCDTTFRQTYLQTLNPTWTLSSSCPQDILIVWFADMGHKKREMTKQEKELGYYYYYPDSSLSW